MRHHTYSFTVQLSPTGRMDLHSWHATYASNGRQIPQAITSVTDLDPGELGYEMTEFLDAVLLLHRQLSDAQQPSLPL